MRRLNEDVRRFGCQVKVVGGCQVKVVGGCQVKVVGGC